MNTGQIHVQPTNVCVCVCLCVVNENSYIMFIILVGLTDWFSPIQGETGPTGPTGATGVRGAPVSASFCNLSHNRVISWCVFGLEIENTSIFYIETQSVLIINSRRFLFFWSFCRQEKRSQM